MIAFSTPRDISDEECTSVLVKENDLLSAIIEANKRQHAHLERRRGLKRVASEIEGHGLAMQHPRKVFNGLFAEISQLKYRRRTNPGDKSQLCVSGIDLMPERAQSCQHNGVISESERGASKEL